MASILQRRGCFIVPSYDFSGSDGDKAPKMQGLSMNFVIPDLDVARKGTRYWVEVKTKKAATLHKMTKTWEHGISLRHWRHYQRVEAETGSPVWLFVYEEETDTILCARLASLGDGRVYDGEKMGRGGMVFWPRANFRIYPHREAAAE